MAAEGVEKPEMRIVAGQLRGRKILCEVHAGLRPTPQAVREALFSILGHAIPGHIFYDIFAGSGITGIEAYSRGAARVNLIEHNGKQAGDLQRTIDRLEVGHSVAVLKADAYRWAERWQPPFADEPVVLFLSPPFPDLVPERVERFLKLVAGLVERAVADSVVVVQAEIGFPVDSLPNATAWDVRTYGRNQLLIFVKPGADDMEVPMTES